MKYILVNVFWAFVFFSASGQQSPNSLEVGEKLPNAYIDLHFDDTVKSINLLSLKEKLTVLDFWNIHCTSCIKAFPEMDSIQKQFGDKIQIILVTKNSNEEVKKLFKRIKVKKPNLPMVIGDTLLNKLFPHNGDPFHVWINEKGLIRAVTFDYNTTPENIKAYLEGQDVKISRRRDFGFDPRSSLLSEKNSNLFPLVKAYSVIYNNLGEFTSWSLIEIIRDSSTKVPFKIHAVNASTLKLLNVAYNKEIFGLDIDVFNLKRNNRIILNVKNPENILAPTEKNQVAAWLANNNQLSYELQVPVTNKTSVFSAMQKDLNSYLNYEAKIEERKVKCLVVVRKSKKVNLSAKSNSDSAFLVKRGLISIRNMTLGNSLIKHIVYANADLVTPIVDDTKFNAKVDMDITCELNDLGKLKTELGKYGLGLIEAKRRVKMLIVRDRR